MSDVDTARMAIISITDYQIHAESIFKIMNTNVMHPTRARE